jgi:hypothetical protein
MAKVVGKARGIDQVGVEPQSRTNFAANLCDLERVCEAVSREIKSCSR